jgi:hypothetical protein
VRRKKRKYLRDFAVPLAGILRARGPGAREQSAAAWPAEFCGGGITLRKSHRSQKFIAITPTAGVGGGRRRRETNPVFAPRPLP